MPEEIWTLWWAWVVAGFALGVLEILAPGYIFAGFAIGAVLTGILVGIGFQAGPALLILVFALLSLLAWIATRALLGKRPGQVKTWHRDINEDP